MEGVRGRKPNSISLGIPLTYVTVASGDCTTLLHPNQPCKLLLFLHLSSDFSLLFLID